MATTKLYLDCAGAGKSGIAPLKIIIRNAGTASHLPTGLGVPPGCWRDGKVVSGKGKELLTYPAGVFNAKIKALHAQVVAIIADEFSFKSNKSASVIRDRVIERLRGDSALEEDSITFSEGIEEYMMSLDSSKTMAAVRSKKNWVHAHLPRVANRRIEDFSVEDARRVHKTLLATLKPNSAKNYLIVYRTTWHFLQKRKLAPKGFDPFEELSIRGVPTRSRALTIEEVREFWFYEPDEDATPNQIARMKEGRDVFRLLIGLTGMNAVDLYRLRMGHVQAGRIRIDRSKTGIPIDLRIEPEVKEIIDRYTDGDGRLVGKLLMMSDEMEKKDSKKRNPMERANGLLNRRLKQLDPRLTTYWLRHTWASLAAELDIPDRVISMGLAHAYGNEMDNIYITNRVRKLDAANRKVLDWIIKGDDAVSKPW